MILYFFILIRLHRVYCPTSVVQNYRNTNILHLINYYFSPYETFSKLHIVFRFRNFDKYCVFFGYRRYVFDYRRVFKNIFTMFFFFFLLNWFSSYKLALILFNGKSFFLFEHLPPTQVHREVRFRSAVIYWIKFNVKDFNMIYHAFHFFCTLSIISPMRL